MNIDAETQALEQTTLAITGMSCGGCARTVERVLSRVDGVASARVDFELGVAIVNGSATPPQLVAAVEAARYGASLANESTTGEEKHEQRRGCC